MIRKGIISNILRSLGLIYLVDWIRFYIQKFRNRNLNQEFLSKYPDAKLPPDYLIYESFQMNYYKYFVEGKDTAKWLVSHLSKHIDLKNVRILDWGCGPGRVVRHLPEVVGNSSSFYGTDYNEKSIEWCSQNLAGISFNKNTLKASLPYESNFFDVIYGISIFTHLSEQMHFDWYSELYRVLKPGGVLLLTTQGENFKTKMTQSEIVQFENGKLVVRGNVKEGHRTYSAFHPKAFMKKLFDNATILEHLETRPEGGRWLPQDVWMVRK